jgi:hypothetical protein
MEKRKAPGMTYKTEPERLPGLVLTPSPPHAKLPTATFQAVVVAGVDMNHARLFLDYIASDAANAVWKRYGFTPK